jgi:DNA-binding SARP family transcriptional activator
MRLRTLGKLELEGGNLQRPKPLLLLCYLALEGPKERRHLAELFWMGATNSLGSLSMALTQLRQGASGSFEADLQRVWTYLETDAKQLLRAAETGELEKVLELYQGRFLDGLYLQDWSAELEEWVYHTREFLAGRVRGVLLRLAEAAAAQQQFELAAKQAEQAYLLSGAPEPEVEELERLYALLLAGGSAQAAQVRKEAESFGISLITRVEEAKEKLHSSLRGSNTAKRHNWPSRGTSFVGRDLEITDITNLLMRNDCCLVTLTGPGGVGKTRLALQVGDALLKQGLFRDGVFFVPLETVSSPNDIPLRLASVLNIALLTNGAS